MSRINIIVAVTNNMVIGKGNDMPWHLPSDLKRFKEITNGFCVIMGRKCWESIPVKYRPLSNRINIVITKNENYYADGATTFYNLDIVEKLKKDGGNSEVFIIGGAQIYKETFKYADRILITRIDADIEGDVFLEGLDMNEWDVVESVDSIEENGYRFKYQTLWRKEKEEKTCIE